MDAIELAIENWIKRYIKDNEEMQNIARQAWKGNLFAQKTFADWLETNNFIETAKWWREHIKDIEDFGYIEGEENENIYEKYKVYYD